MFFTEVNGLYNIKKNLIKTVFENRISHAQLFSGKSGYEHLKLALAYAQFVNCLNPQPDDSCGKCLSCIKYNKLQHPDLHLAFPTTTGEKSIDVINTFRTELLKNPYLTEQEWALKISKEPNKQLKIRAEDARDIIHRLSYKAYEAKYKVQIIWLPEYLQKEGNVLLKLIEEPPDNTLILLVTNDIDNILPTILSRCQLIKVPRLSDQHLVQYLVQQHECNEDKAIEIARIAEGNTGYAIELLKDSENGYFENFSNWMRACYSLKADEISKWVDAFSGGREYNKSFLKYSMHMLRNAFIMKHVGSDQTKVNATEKKFLENFTKVITHKNYIPLVQLMDESIYHIERNANQKITFFHLSLQVGKLLKQ